MTEKRLRFGGQPMRSLRYIREHPGASSLDITRDLFIVNVTGRISDLRAAGYRIDCRKRPDGYDGYSERRPEPVTTGTQEGLW